MKDQKAILTIGFGHVLLPADKALKVAQLLTGAISVSDGIPHLEGNGITREWRVRGEIGLRVEMCSSKDRFVSPSGDDCSVEPRKTRRAIGQQRLALPAPNAKDRQQ